MDRGGSGAVNAIVAIAALLVIASIIYPYAKEWWETQGPGSPTGDGEGGITSIQSIVGSPESYENKQVTVIGVFNQARYGLTEGDAVMPWLSVRGWAVNRNEYQSLYLRNGYKYKATGIVGIFPLDYSVEGENIASAGDPWLSVADVRDIIPYDELATPISAIVENPEDYINKQVSVIGKYTSPFRLVGEDGSAVSLYPTVPTTSFLEIVGKMQEKRWYEVTGVVYYVQGVLGIDVNGAIELMWGQPLELS